MPIFNWSQSITRFNSDYSSDRDVTKIVNILTILYHMTEFQRGGYQTSNPTKGQFSKCGLDGGGTRLSSEQNAIFNLSKPYQSVETFVEIRRYVGVQMDSTIKIQVPHIGLNSSSPATTDVAHVATDTAPQTHCHIYNLRYVGVQMDSTIKIQVSHIGLNSSSPSTTDALSHLQSEVCWGLDGQYYKDLSDPHWSKFMITCNHRRTVTSTI